MAFLIIMTVVVALIFGAVFCMCLIGGVPWSKNDKGFAPVRIMGKSLSFEEFAIGITLFFLGVLWLITWGYFLTQNDASFSGAITLSPLQMALPLLTGLALLASGIAVFLRLHRWKGIYLTGVATVLGCFGTAIFIALPKGTETSKAIYVLGGITFVIVGGLSMVVYLIDRISRKKQ